MKTCGGYTRPILSQKKLESEELDASRKTFGNAFMVS